MVSKEIAVLACIVMLIDSCECLGELVGFWFKLLHRCASSVQKQGLKSQVENLKKMNNQISRYSAQWVPELDRLPGISFDTRPDPIQF